MAYKSYDISKQKIRTLWEENKKQEENIDELTNINLDWNSINFKKGIYTKEETVISEPSTGHYVIIELKSFPDWIIPYINIALIAGSENKIEVTDYATEGAYNCKTYKFWETSEIEDDEHNIQTIKTLQYYFKFNWYSATDIKFLIKVVNPRVNYEIRKPKT